MNEPEDQNAAFKRHMAYKRERQLNRTWRNPRWYIVFVIFPIALPPAIICGIIAVAGDALKWLADRLDDFLRWFWSPLEKWVSRGEKPRPGTGIATHPRGGQQTAAPEARARIKCKCRGAIHNPKCPKFVP